MARRRDAAVAAVEVALAAAVVLLDVLLPSLVLVVMAAISLIARRRGPSTLGFRWPAHPGRLAVGMLGFAVGWAALHVTLLDPVVSHATGERQDTSDFAGLQGDVGRLLLLLALSWTLAAVAEETAFRGYVLTRTYDAVTGRPSSTVLAVMASALLFGLVHTEQGLVGVVLATIDGVVLGLLRLRCRTLWAPVLVHGFSNTIGFIAFFLAGPIDPLW